MASTLTKSKGSWTRLLLNKTSIFTPSRKTSNLLHFHPSSYNSNFIRSSLNLRFFSANPDPIKELLAELRREVEKEREEKRKAGISVAEEDDEDEQDWMGVQPLIDKFEKDKMKETGPLMQYEEPSESDSDEDDEYFNPEATARREEIKELKIKRHKELLKNFVDAETIDEAFKWMASIDKFEEKHIKLPLEYRVVGEMLNCLKEATGKERFMLLQKLNRAMRFIQRKEAYDPSNPENYGVIKHDEDRDEEASGKEDSDADDEPIDNEEEDSVQEVGKDQKIEEWKSKSESETETESEMESGEKEKEKKKKEKKEDEDEDFDEDDEEKLSDEKEEALRKKLNAIDKKIEEKLADLDHTFGKKRRVLEEAIKDLADKRNSLTEKERLPLYRKGFDVQLIDVNRTCKVTQGGQVISFSAILACGNYNGIVGYAKARAPQAHVAIQKAYEKCFQDLHYIERHEEHTIAHAVQTNYKKTKVYLWPASTRTGMVAGPTVKIILNLAGFKNIKSKVIGSRNRHNTIRAVFKALNAVETPKDVQEKLGRTVVESYLV